MQNIYFLGAGGIGMSALVRYFLSQGYTVGGYDRVETPLTKKLCEEGAAIHYEDGEQHIPACFKDKAATLVVYTPAIPATMAREPTLITSCKRPMPAAPMRPDR